jgi:hypothetical protein
VMLDVRLILYIPLARKSLYNARAGQRMHKPKNHECSDDFLKAWLLYYFLNVAPALLRLLLTCENWIWEKEGYPWRLRRGAGPF